MTPEVTAANQWAGEQLRARRLKKNLTQEALAGMAGIDAKRYNALERGRVAISVTYAARLAPHLDLPDAHALLPPSPAAVQVTSPLDRLAELAVTVDRLETALGSVLDRLEALEGRVQQARRREHGGR